MIQSLGDVERHVQGRVPEGPGLEYKQTLVLDPPGQRLETLKDLSGLGNGGGATVIYGVAKDPNNPELPSHIVPLNDPVLPGRLEDIIRAGIRPPFLAEYRRIDHPDGYLLTIEVARSPLGPYMVEGYGDWRHNMRRGSRTEPMTEQQVRDAYALAFRARERRPQIWEEHQLPLIPLAKAPCLCVSALPEEPLQELLDVGSVEPANLQPPADLGALCEAAHIPGNLYVWTHGFFGEEEIAAGFWVRLRLYRDGAIASALGFPAGSPDIRPIPIARLLHAQLAYMGWVWSNIRLRNPVEIRIDLHHIQVGRLDARGPYGEGVSLSANRPGDLASPLMVSIRSEELPGSLLRARTRHQLVRGFLDRVYQAYGRQRAPATMFAAGWLYGSDGSLTDYYIVGGGVFRGRSGDDVGRVYSDGHIERSTTAAHVGYSAEGVFLDTSGNAIAAVEMATGSGLPDDFMVKQFTDAAIIPRLGTEPQQAPPRFVPPPPTKQWSGARMTDLFRP